MKRSRLLASASVIGSLTMVSRLLGMVRTMIAASIFGRGLAMDAFVIAFTIPNLFRRLLGEGALTSAFLPVYSHTLEKEGKGRAQLFFDAILTRVGLLLLLLVGLGIGACFFVEATIEGTPLLEAGLHLTGNWGKVMLTTSLLKVLFPYLFLICVTALLSALLNSLGHFASPAMAPIVLNLFWIAGLLWVAPYFGMTAEQKIFGVAVAVIVGGAAQVLSQVPALRHRGIGFRPRWRDAPPEVGEVATLMAPMVFGAAVVQINVLLDKGIALTLVPETGAVSALYYGDRIIQFPLGLFGIAIATAVFPVLSRHAARGEIDLAARGAADALKAIFAVTLPATVGLALLARPVVELILEHGAFRGVDTDRTAQVLLFYTFGLWAFSGTQILTRAFYSLKWPRIPVRVAAGMVVLNLVLNLSLVGTLQAAGLALATAITGVVQFVILAVLLGRHLPAIRDFNLPASFLRSLGLSLLMGLGVWACLEIAMPVGTSVGVRLARAGVPIATGAALYGGLAWAFRTPEFRVLLAILRRRDPPTGVTE